MKTLKKHLPALLALTMGMSAGSVRGQVTLFSDDFTTDTSANWTIQAGSGTGTDDYTAQFAFHYATNTYTSNGVILTIPLAPNSTVGAATNGVKLTVNNNDEVADTAAVNLYPSASQIFSNDYTLKFDLWVNYNGLEGGGAGSTEFALFGINAAVTNVTWTFGTNAAMWFAVTGEGGAARDWRAYAGDNFEPPLSAVELTGVSGGFLDRDGDSTPEQERFTEPNTAPLKLLFPKPLFETDGVPGKRWVQVEVRQRTNELGQHFITWLMDGYVVAQHNQADIFTWTSGNIVLGMMDIFSSIANPREENFVIFDNVSVQDLSGVPTNEVVSVVATDPVAVEPGDTATLTLSRTGSTAGSLAVPFRTAGTATRGSDYLLQTNGVTVAGNVVIIPAGQESIDITIAPQDDTVSESQETAYLVIGGNIPGFDIGLGAFAFATIDDDGLDVPSATVGIVKTNAYERIESDTAILSVNLSSTANTDVTVNIAITDSGAGPSYTVTPSATAAIIPAGTTNVLVNIVPVNDSAVTDDRAVTLTINSGTGYTVGAAATRTVRVRNDDLAADPVLFADDFESPVAANNWGIRFSAANGVTDYTAIHGFDYGAAGIPSAPNSTGGTTKGYFTTANKDATGSAAAVNIYMTNQNFSGSYALRFDMFMSVDGGFAGTTEHSIFGINHSGNITNRHGIAGSDGLWYAVETDGSANNLYASYVGGTNATPGFVAIQTLPGEFIAPPWGYSGSPAVQTNTSTLTSSERLWSDVQVIQDGMVVTLIINGVQIFQRTNTSAYTSGKIMIGHMDRFNSLGSQENFTIFDNVRVVSLAAPIITITNIALIGGNVQIDFTGSPADGPSSFTLQAAGTVDGTYGDVTATITELSPGSFRAVRALAGPQQFYRIRRQ